MAKQWRHEEIAELLAKLTIKSSRQFLEKPAVWMCPGCGRSKEQIVAPGHNVDIIACIHGHHDHISNLIWDLVCSATGPRIAPEAIKERQQLIDVLERKFCRFQETDICHACNAVDPAAKAIVKAPRWFSFSPHGIASMIQRPVAPYAVKHDINRDRLAVIWEKVSIEIAGLEGRIRHAIQQERREVG